MGSEMCIRDSSCGTFFSHAQQCGIAQSLAEAAEGQDLLFSGNVCWLARVRIPHFLRAGLQKLKIAGLCVTEEPEGRCCLRDSCGSFFSHVQQCGIAQSLAEAAEGQDLLFSGSVCWLARAPIPHFLRSTPWIKKCRVNRVAPSRAKLLQHALQVVSESG